MIDSQVTAPVSAPPTPQPVQTQVSQSMPVSAGMAPPVTPSSAPILQKKSGFNVLVLLWIFGGLSLLCAIVAGIYFFSPKNELIIDDQQTTTVIHVRKLHLVQPASLILHRVSIEEGGNNTLATTRFLEPEDYLNFDITIGEGVTLKPGDRIYATLNMDTDHDETINLEFDKSVKDIFGREFRMYFNIL